MEARKAERAESIFKRVLAEIKPSQAETNSTIAGINTVMGRLGRIVEKGVELKVVGSVARGTNLKGDGDIDIFVLFHKKTGKEELVRKGLSYGKRLAAGKGDRYEIKYAEHPYVRVYLQELGVKIDLVPALKIDNIEEMGTTVDRTPLHTNFINANLTDRQRDDTRLLKYLLKAHHIYGAEVKVGGFPGYLCELLVYQYGSLLKLLENAALFAPPVVLDPKTKSRLSDQNLAKKFNSNFIVIDPVDDNRNVAAGVSAESLGRFVLVARSFIANPRAEAFYGKGFSDREAARLLGNFAKSCGLSMYLIRTRVPAKSEDVVWPQLRKMGNVVSDTLERYDYQVYMTIPWVSGRYGFIMLVLPHPEVPTRLLRGPDIYIRQAAENFLKGHREAMGTVMRGSSIYLLERNKYPDAESALRAIMGGGLIKRHKDISLKSASLFVNSVPREYAVEAYSELLKRTTI